MSRRGPLLKKNWCEVARYVRGRALDCGHFLPEEKPDDVLREVCSFLARVSN